MKSTIITYPAVFHQSEDGRYDVSFPDLPGCVTFGQTLEEAQDKAAEVLGLWLEELEAEHKSLPRVKPPIIADISPALA